MITIICSGSRGDYQPYVALAKELKKQGKEVRITAGRSQKDFVTKEGIEVYDISIDVTDKNIDPKILEDAGSSDNPIKMLLTFNKMKHLGYQMLKESFEACKGSELIIYHPGCAVGYFAAQELNIPSVMVSPFPIHKNDEYLSVVMYGKAKNTKLNRTISYKLLYKMLWMASSLSIKKLWKESYGRLPKNYGCIFDLPDNKSIISCSNEIFSSSKNVHQNGYLFLEEDSYKPDKELLEFLGCGEKPIYFGFGSMIKQNEREKFAGIIINALKKANKRGVLYGFGEIKDLPDNIITVKITPHSWLFPKMAAVCHHGGAGTSAEGFRAGIPSIIVPFSNDQFAWAHRSFDLGVGAKPIYKKEFSEDRLLSALDFISKEEIKQKAQILGDKISQEKGVYKAVDEILNMLK